MAKFLDTDHPMFRPLWVRVLIVAGTAGWAVVEFVAGEPLWGAAFGGAAAYAGWKFFVDPDQAAGEDRDPE